MPCRYGIVELAVPRDESDTEKITACVRIHRAPFSGWKASRVTDLTACEPAVTARLLAPYSTIVVDGTEQEIEDRKVRLERFGGRKLCGAFLSRGRKHSRALLAGANGVADLCDGARGVAVQLALAAVAALVCREPAFSIYWGWKELRFLTVTQHGSPVSAIGSGHPCVVLTPPDREGEALIDSVTPCASVIAARSLPGNFTPLEILALGVALARDTAGTFPVRERRGAKRLTALRWLAPAAFLAAGTGLFWRAEESSLAPLRSQIDEERRAVESLDQKLRSRSAAARLHAGEGTKPR